MNRLFVAALILAASCTLSAQTPDAGSYSSSNGEAAAPLAGSTQAPVVQNAAQSAPAFSRVSFGAGVSPLGIGLQVSTNLNPHLNVRAIGNIFKYSTTFTESGIPANADLNLASAGGLVDYYPWHSGFRLSGGILFVNQNQVSADASIAPGDSITLNDQTYYSATRNQATGATPLTGGGSLYLNKTSPGAIVTTGWGNHVKRSGHWSFPFELGVAFVGTPQVRMHLGGWACTDASQTFCSNIADPASPEAMQFQGDLNAQIAKWNSDLSALSSYPVVSFGVAYSFQTRRY